MIGTNLNLSLPSLSDTMATIVSKTATALSAIQTSLADKATPAGLNINTALNMGGNALTNVGSLQLAVGNGAQTPGSIAYFNGAFYVTDATGTAIQLTANGQINIGGTGGFVGDYVASNSTGAAYDLASGQFRFTKSVGVWADLAYANTVLEGANGTVKIGVDAAINTARVANFKSLPTSNVSLLVYNAATSTIEDGGVTAITNPPTMQGATFTADVHLTYTRKLVVPLGFATRLTNCGFTAISGTSTGLDGAAAWLGSSGNWEFTSQALNGLGLVVGDRIKTVRIVHKTIAGTHSWNLYKLVAAGGGSGTATLVGSGSASSSNDHTDTIGSPVAIAAGEMWFLDLTGNTTGDLVTLLEITYDHP